MDFLLNGMQNPFSGNPLGAHATLDVAPDRDQGRPVSAAGTLLDLAPRRPKHFNVKYASQAALDRRTNYNCAWVDFARAAAALCVVVSHVRPFVFVDFTATPRPGWASKAFYFATGLGHQAVIVFFVLSGFLVGGYVYAAVAEGRWSWSEYFAKRLIRLLTVLVPALVLTAVWDRIGITLTHSPLYFGGLSNWYHSGPILSEQNDIYSFSVFSMNILFLQTTNAVGLGTIPTFGTNGPLWSLANEFWYYILFPLIFVPLSLPKLKAESRLTMLMSAAILCIVLPKTMVLSGTIWLLGVAAFVFNRNVTLGRTAYKVAGWISAVSTAVAIWVARTNEPGLESDFCVGAAFSALLVSLARSGFGDGLVVRMSRRMARFSYTLYLTHFPLAALMACWLLENRRVQPSPEAFLVFGSMVVLLLIYAYGVSLLFENNTQAVHTYFNRLLAKGPTAPAGALTPRGGH
jgi:peptidoglycan/LPS O-acetylase OafA/YrhL